MVLNETANLTFIEVAKTVSPLITGNLLPFMNILKAAGAIFAVYLILLIVQIISRFNDSRRLKRMETKLDLLLTKKRRN